MNRIKLLDKNTINQIAAGEVIERPASVVKELVENSIDAGATKVEISISNDCRNIRIADNGSGIHPDDVELAFVKHATSKISTEKDLYNINSFGFRGEALASIISISKLTATTRTKEFDYGIKVECENSETKKTQTGCAVGTIIDVKDLFFNLPVRLKFLKSTSTEFSYISEITQLLALSNPNVSLILKNKDTELLRTSGSGNLKTTICEIYTATFLDKLRIVSKTDELSKLTISGYVATPDFSRSSKKSIITFINGRVVHCNILNKAIETAYKSTLPIKRYPFAIIDINIPNTDVDINVHPQKKEVRYKNTNQIFQFTYSAVEQALSTTNNSLNKTEQPEKSLTEIFASKKYQDVEYATEKTNDTSLQVSQNKNFSYQKTFNPIQKNIPKFSSMSQTTKEFLLQENIEFQSDKEPMNIDTERNYRIIGQYKKTYIILETNDEFQIIDQHIANERYNFEKLMKTKENNSQILLISDIIKVEEYEKNLLNENISALNQCGYEINFINDDELIFKKVPQMVSNIPTQELFYDIIATLKDESKRNLIENILTSIACKASVKAGENLSYWQMDTIIQQWLSTSNPYTCPHGRPVVKSFKHSEIANFFLRNK